MKYIVVLIVVALALWLLLRGRGAAQQRGREEPPRRVDDPSQRDAAPIDMVACANCGVHLPRHEALFDAQGRIYCGTEHRLAGPR